MSLWGTSYLIPFFTNNKFFESLGVSYLKCSEMPSDGRFDSLEYVLQQFNSLKELRVSSNGGIDGADLVTKNHWNG